MKTTLFKGAPTFTAFRFQRRKKALQKIFPNITLQTISDYYMIASELVQDVDYAKMIRLLPDGTELAEAADLDDSTFWITPRLGTISPWSSKATDIFKRCGLSSVVRVERIQSYTFEGTLDTALIHTLSAQCHDPLTESVIIVAEDLQKIFSRQSPQPLRTLSIAQANTELGLGWDAADCQYLSQRYQALGRDPTDVELMMFAQVNSEHCRHKIFNAAWNIDGKAQEQTLFDMIRYTYRLHPEQVLVAYKDNAAVLRGHRAKQLAAAPDTQIYRVQEQYQPIVLKVETHNHPTGIAPQPGAATGSGGEIRDEAATGRGAMSKAGLCGFSVSELNIVGLTEPWVLDVGKPEGMASGVQIMLEGPIGAAAFNNEFGRPCLLGYFRTFLSVIPAEAGVKYYGYHKPIMIAGGIGTISEKHIEKSRLKPGALLIVLGGPAMAIGLGGGSASSQTSGSLSSEHDFASVQRANPEMQRRCQEVINSCVALDDKNPILSIHDVGAGGLSNALPELVEACGQGAKIDLRQIPNDEPGMSPMEIWCNEAQERYVLAIDPASLAVFKAIAARERCLMAVVGEVIAEDRLHVVDAVFPETPVDLPMTQLLGSLPQRQCRDQTRVPNAVAIDYSVIDFAEAVDRVLRFPCVADKRFLITIGDRSVGGLVARDQMIGPWQVAVSDVAVTAADYEGVSGEAVAMGERAPVAVLNSAASARMAVGEAITNIAAASITRLSDLGLSANWMASASEVGEGAALYAAVKAVGLEFCPALGISIPVGKDSLSMTTRWKEQGVGKAVTSPVSLIVTAAAPVNDIRKTLTSELQRCDQSTVLCLIDLSETLYPMGGSVLAQVYDELGDVPPDIDPNRLKAFFGLIQVLNQKELLLAYHDRSDGGLFATVAEMLFCSRLGADLRLPVLPDKALPYLFHESLGAVIQVKQDALSEITKHVQQAQLQEAFSIIGEVNSSDLLTITCGESLIYQQSRGHLHQQWSAVSYHMQRLRDNPDCAESEYGLLEQTDDPGLLSALFYEEKRIAVNVRRQPRVVILREQGVNGHREMAAAFHAAGFEAVDVTMADLLAGATLDGFQGMAACGGFSYGDVLGAGRGWAQSILEHPALYDQFSHFFHRGDTFTLGVCNGCQMLSQIKKLIPGATHWPRFIRNVSEQFEARFLLTQVTDSPSLFFQGMQGWCLPVPVAHGEGLVDFGDQAADQALMSLQYVDHHRMPTEQYPFNPNGSVGGAAGYTTTDGRATILMPHPERVFRFEQWSVRPKSAQGLSPWANCFQNFI